METRHFVVAVFVLLGGQMAVAQTCGWPPAECSGTLHCGGEWDFESGFYFTSHYLAGQCEGPDGGHVSCVPGDKMAEVGNGWVHWASFPTWPTAGYWGTVSFNVNKNCDNVYRGNRSQELTMTCANGVGVIYKQASVPVGHRIRAQAQMRFTANGAAPDVEHALGVDPAGGTNPSAPGIVWTVWQQPNPAGWNSTSVQAVSAGGMVTVFIRQRAFEPECQGQTFMIDDVRVYDDGPAGPAMEVVPSSLDVTAFVEADAVARTLSIRNSGTGTLDYALSTATAWLDLSPTSGTATTEVDSVTVTFSTSTLEVGHYAGQITATAFGAANSPVIVPVSLTIINKPGDLDHDRDVDQTDFGLFQRCYSGPNVPYAGSGCPEADLDNDADVDTGDFSRFQSCFSGPGAPSDPGCLQ